jgi:hypothetical protein
MVLSSIIQAGIPVHAYVNEYQRFADKMAGIAYIEDANISLYENGIYIGDFSCFKDTFNGEIVYGLPDFFPSPGNTYAITARTGDMEVTGSTTIPPPVSINEVNTFIEPVNKDRNLYKLNFEISFQDPPLDKNLYIITLEGGYQELPHLDFLSRRMGIESDDPVIEGDIGSFLYFTDNSIDGLSVTISFYTIENFDPGDTLKYRVNLRSVSNEFYEYCKALDKYNSTREDYYAEPASIYTNIENGWGAVVGFSGSYTDPIIFSR